MYLWTVLWKWKLLPQDGEKVVFTEDAWQKGLSGGGDHVPKTNGTGVVFMRRRSRHAA